jgi:predicted DNA-binding transcriptional regulator AlpA
MFRLVHTRSEANMDTEHDAYGVEDFCKRHGFSRAYLYLLWKRGTGPRFMQVGSRRLISKEAAADWRRSMEQASSVAVAA